MICTRKTLSNARNINLRSYYRYASTFTSPDVVPVDMEYTAFIPPDGNKQEGAVVIVHGLFGSKRNWTTLSKAFMRDLDKPVYALDLRNQGASPHVSPMTYQHMAADVLHFIQKHSLSNVSLMGHSMGGKVAMASALSLPPAEPSVLSNLISVDMAPTDGKLSPEFISYIDAMKKIEAMDVKTRKEAMEVLEEYEQDPAVRQFLLTNLTLPTSASTTAKFQIPLSILGEAIQGIGAFPYAPGEKKWEGRTLFIKGDRSKYINRRNIPLCEAFFPNYKLESLDTGHWVHAERSNEFKKLVVDFIKAEVD